MIVEKVGLKCTSCTACQSVCPKQAISMIADKEGFEYPHIDKKKCINCGLCEKVCPVLHGQMVNKYHEPIVYAAWNKSPIIRENSTSGGVFSALAEIFIRQGGYVVGAIYGEELDIYHIISDSKEEIERLRQSKYAQSRLNGIFAEIKNLLRQGKKVLFCGTPCQSAGLQNYLRKPYETLYCCDFICRGVISQKVYRKYLHDIAEVYHSAVVKVHFKNKDYGWNRFSTRLTLENGDIYQKDRNEDCYMKGYLKHNLYLRPSCHECCFKEIPRISDVSLGDFWGIGNYKRELDEDRGTSVVLVNSGKGHELLEYIKDDLVIERRTLEEVLKGNACLLNRAVPGKYRNYFFRHMNRVPFEQLIDTIDYKSLNWTLKERIKSGLYKVKVKIIGNK